MAAVLGFSSCSIRQEPLIIWTDSVSFANYVEMFNSTETKTKAVVVYKENPSTYLPPVQDELQPDIVIGSYLKNSNVRRNFASLDYLFEEKKIYRSAYYSQLLNYGIINQKQYLLPVSFNLPLIIFNSRNESYVKTEHLLNIAQLNSFAADFNTKNKQGNYTAMGFAPAWDPNFIYEVTKLLGTDYTEKGSSFTWNNNALNSSIENIKQWSVNANTNTMTEQNFQFRYLYMPKYRQVSSSRCLFAYTTSDSFFTLAESQKEGLDFRWLENRQTIPVEDNIICLGIYRNSSKYHECEEFISWFFKPETQKKLLERNRSMNLGTVDFGIAGGFSSIKIINENVFPVYYRNLLGNLPSEKNLSVPKMLPLRWSSLKERVIIPYLQESTDTSSTKPVISLEERISNWTKQFY